MFMSFFSFFAGVLLGQRFKVLILLPAIAILIVITIGMAGPKDAWPLIFGATLVTVALQIGYVSGGLIATRMTGHSFHGSDFVLPLLVSFTAVFLTTIVLSILDTLTEAKHLVMGYLLPATLIAIYYGSALAVFTTFASGVAAAYVLLPPRFSFQIEDYLNVAELGFFMLLSIIASKAMSSVARDR